MIGKWFAYFFNSGMMVSVIIALILAVRVFMGRFPKKYCYMLWSIVLLRILCPLEITSSVSVFNLLGDSCEIIRVNEQSAEGAYAFPNQEEPSSGSSLSETRSESSAMVLPADQAGDPLVTAPEKDPQAIQKTDAFHESLIGDKSENTDTLYENGAGNKTDAAGEEMSGQDRDDGSKWEVEGLSEAWMSWFVTYGSFVWVCGVLGLFFWNVLLLIIMKWRVRTSVLLRDHIYECDGIPSPFVMGFVKPRIYIPFRLSEEEQDYIIKHEEHHIARRDNFIKLIALAILCLYWFCPLFWIAWFFMNRDMEMSCDEYVLRRSSKDIRADYSRSLLGFAVNQRNRGLGVTSFGESDVRRRVKHIMTSKKYRTWISGAAVILILAVGVICLTNAKPDQGKKEEDISQETAGGAVEDEVPEGKTKSGKELLTEEYGIAAVTNIHDYRVEVQCFSGGTDETYMFGDRLMIQTSRGNEVIDVCEVDFELGGIFYFPKGGFDIYLADFDGDGDNNDFVLGQGQAKEPRAGNFMKYRFFGVGKDGMITGYHVSGEDDFCIGTLPDDDYSPVFQRKNGEIHYEGLSKSGVKKKKVSIIKYLPVAEAAGRDLVCPRMELIRNNMPEEVVMELEQNGVWRICYGETPKQVDCNLGNAERADEITLRLDFHYENNRLTKYVCKDYGFMDTVAAAEGDGKQAAFQFSWDFTDFVGKDDDMMTEKELPQKWKGAEYKYYEDMRGATYRIDSRINMVVEYEDLDRNKPELDPQYSSRVSNIRVSLPNDPVQILSGNEDKEYIEYKYNSQSLNQSVHLRYSESEHALEQMQAKKLGSREYWSYLVDGKEKMIHVEAYENEKGKAFAICYWKEKGVHFWLYTRIKGEYGKTPLLDTDYIILVKEAAEIAASMKKC